MSQKAKRKFSHLTLPDRKQIEFWLAKWRTSVEIGSALGFNQSSILRELHRNGGRENYNADSADLRARKQMINRNKKDD